MDGCRKKGKGGSCHRRHHHVKIFVHQGSGAREKQWQRGAVQLSPGINGTWLSWSKFVMKVFI